MPVIGPGRRHPTARAGADDEGEEQDKDPERARIEAVDEGDDEGRHQERPGADIDGAKERQLQRLARPRPLVRRCGGRRWRPGQRRRDGGSDRPPDLGRVADEDATADEHRRHGAGLDAVDAGEHAEGRVVGVVPPDLAAVRDEARVTGGEYGQERLLRLAMRAAVTPEDVERERRCRFVVGECRGREAQQPCEKGKCW